MADNGIQEVDPETGVAKQVISGKLAVPAGIGVVSDGGKDTIYVADVFAYRTVDGATGEVSEVARMFADGVMLEIPRRAPPPVGIPSFCRAGAGARSRSLTERPARPSRCCVASRNRMMRLSSMMATFWSTNSAPSRCCASAATMAENAPPSSASWVDRWASSRAPPGSAYLTEALTGQVSKVDASGNKTVIAKDLKMPRGDRAGGGWQTHCCRGWCQARRRNRSYNRERD